MQNIGNHLSIPGNQNEEVRPGEGRQQNPSYQQRSYPLPSNHHPNQHYIHLQPQNYQPNYYQNNQPQQYTNSQQLPVSTESVSSKKKVKLLRDGVVLSHRCPEPDQDEPMESDERSRKTSTSVQPVVDPCESSTSSVSNSPKKGKRAKKSTRIDVNVKLERSRQSARECRARKKLRYQYLEDLVNKREKAVFSLRKEIDTYKDWCKQVDDGVNPKEALVALHLDKQTDFLRPTG